jgi:hypothetical protein
MRDLTDRKVVKKLEKAAEVRAREDGLVMKNLMNTMAGRAFIYGKLERAHVFATSFSPNALTMAFAEGERSRGLELLSDIMTYCPEQYVPMMREANGRYTATERSVDSDGDGRVEGSDLDDPGPDSSTNGLKDPVPNDDTPSVYREWEAAQRNQAGQGRQTNPAEREN